LLLTFVGSAAISEALHYDIAFEASSHDLKNFLLCSLFKSEGFC